MRLGSRGGRENGLRRGRFEADSRGADRTSPDRTVNQSANAQSAMSTSDAHSDAALETVVFINERTGEEADEG